MKQIDQKKEPGPRARGNTRDTRKWCRGKVGVLHTYELQNYLAMKHPSLQGTFSRSFLINVCTRCGRHGAFKRNPAPLPTSPISP